MPVATTSGEQVVEAVVAVPDGANRLYTVTGAAGIAINVSAGQTQTQTWTFLVGPTLHAGSFIGRSVRPQCLRSPRFYKRRRGTLCSQSAPSKLIWTMNLAEWKYALKFISLRVREDPS